MNGIGGNTIHEVKNNLTREEVYQWAEYRYRRGSLNVGRRTEQAVGYLIANYFNSKISDTNKHYDPIEFMPHEDDVEVGFEAVILSHS